MEDSDSMGDAALADISSLSSKSDKKTQNKEGTVDNINGT